MAYNEYLADLLRNELSEHKVLFEEKKMMGGLCFMVEDKMCVGIINDDLMARVGPHEYEHFLERPGVRIMDFTKRPMKGYVYGNAEIWEDPQELTYWLRQCLVFNKEAKSSKKK